MQSPSWAKESLQRREHTFITLETKGWVRAISALLTNRLLSIPIRRPLGCTGSRQSHDSDIFRPDKWHLSSIHHFKVWITEKLWKKKTFTGHFNTPIPFSFLRITLLLIFIGLSLHVKYGTHQYISSLLNELTYFIFHWQDDVAVFDFPTWFPYLN